MSPKPRKRTAQSKPARTSVYLIGEFVLVREYAELCASKGYAVYGQWNSSGTRHKSSKSNSIQRSNIVPSKTSLALELTNTNLEQKKKNLQKLDGALPSTCAIVSTSVTVTASEQSAWISERHRLVGFAALPGFCQNSLVEIAPTVFSPKETIDVVRRFFGSIGKKIELVQDRVGLVFPRILCQIINEALFAIQEDIAKPRDIDFAAKLGLNFPLGPIELADKIGFGEVHAVLSALENDLRDSRYRICPLLKQMAQTNEWWKSEVLRDREMLPPS